MKCYRRWLFNGVALLSLVIWLAAAGMWVQSYWIVDGLIWIEGPKEQCWICSSCGGIRFSHTDGPYVMSTTRGAFYHDVIRSPGYYPYFEYPIGTPITDMRTRGFQFIFFNRSGDHIQSVTFPLALIVFAGLIPSVIWARREIKRRQISQAGLCAHCRYDLRATPDRCPECGTIPPKREIIST